MKRLRRDSFGYQRSDPAKKVLYYCPQMKALAESVAEQAKQDGNLQISLGEISWGKFPDGFPNLFVEGAESIRGKHVGRAGTWHTLLLPLHFAVLYVNVVSQAKP